MPSSNREQDQSSITVFAGSDDFPNDTYHPITVVCHDEESMRALLLYLEKGMFGSWTDGEYVMPNPRLPICILETYKRGDMRVFIEFYQETN